MEAQINDTRIKKHISKIDDLLDVSPVVESQQWKTNISWPNMKILEDNFNWGNDAEDTKEDIHGEKEDEEENNEIDGEEK
ncbi:hypothetical protein RMATCC62417_10651 [Rhizopus microsporus]|nr:hypothetical protein RMATCC62417_10651 [Rhizopus microsporus]